jgi:hypothetical protein
MAIDNMIKDWTEIVNVMEFLKCIIIGFVISYSISANATILHVPQNYTLIQEAIDASQSGDTVLVERGEYFELLTIPNRNLFLCSNYLYSGDIADRDSTIINGDWLGTVVHVTTTDRNQFTLKGFTLKKGSGAQGIYGGAIHADLENDPVLYLSDLRFDQNRASHAGAIVFCENNAEVFVNNWLVNSYCDLSYQERVILHIYFRVPKVELNTIEIFGDDCENSLYLTAVSYNSTDKLIAKHITLRNASRLDDYYPGTMLGFGGDSVYVSDMIIDNCQIKNNKILSIRSDGSSEYSKVEVHRLQMTNCTQTGSMGDEDYPIRIWGTPLIADSLIFNNNIGQARFTIGTLMSLEPLAGTLSRIYVEDNQAGILEAEDIFGRVGILEIFNCNLADSRFLRNTSQLAIDTYGTNTQAVSVGSVLIYEASGVDSVTMEDCIFEDNEMFDPDDYTDPTVFRTANTGRVLYAEIENSWWNQTMIGNFRRILIQNNRIENVPPEDNNYEGGFLNERKVGSTVELRCNTDHSANGLVVINVEDMQMLVNDDGGLYMFGFATNVVKNCEFIDNDRYALRLVTNGENSSTIENVLIKGTNAVMATLPPSNYNWSLHCALSLNGGTTFCSNVSIIDCDIPIMVVGATSNYAPTQFRNMIFHDVNYSEFINQMGTNHGSSYQDPIFSYSAVPEPVMGNANMINVDPLFDLDLGAPYLATNSPLIDAGNPDFLYRDLENPATPGYALWPSQGDLRNDIGYTGGPGARLMEFVDVQKRPDPSEMQARPLAATLGNAYPNPFNPVTHIPYHLPRPTEVTITVFDILGRQVAVLEQGLRAAGEHRVLFDGSVLASGMYFVKLQVGGQVDVRKILLVK